MSQITINQKHIWKELNLSVMRKKIRIYEKQRSIDESRVEELKRHFIKGILTNQDPKIRGPFTICCVEDLVNEFVLIDGQHRFEAICKIIDGIVNDCKLMFHIIVAKNINEVHEEFRTINKNVPVPVHFLDVNDFVNEITTMIIKSYPKALNKNKQCKRPSICIDTFKDALIKSNVTNHVSFMDNTNVTDSIFKKICEYSRTLGEKGVEFFISRVNSKKEKQTAKNI